MVSCAWRSSGSVDTPPGGFQSQRSPCWNLFFMFQFSTMHVPCFTEDEPTNETLFWPKCEQHTFIFIFQNPIRKLLWNMGYSFGIWNMVLEIGIWFWKLEYGIWFWNMELQNMILSRIMFSIFQNHVPKLYSIFKNHVPKPYSMFQNHIPKPYFKSMFQKPTNQKFHVPYSMVHVPQKKWANQRTTHKFQQGTEHRPLEPKKNTPLPSDVPPPRPGVSQRGTNRSVSPSSITWRDGCPVCKLQYCNIYLASLTMDLGDP